MTPLRSPPPSTLLCVLSAALFLVVALQLPDLTEAVVKPKTHTPSLSQQETLEKTRSKSSSVSMSAPKPTKSKTVSASLTDAKTVSATYLRYSPRLTCPRNITAGTPLACIAQYAVLGNLVGTQTCMVRLNVCGVSNVYLNNATLKGIGLFQFTFVPTVAGRLVVSANYNGTLLGKQYVFVKSAAASLATSGSQCSVINATSGLSSCMTVWRDRFGNIAKSCNATYVVGSAAEAVTQCNVL